MIIIVINSIGLLICTLISENKGLEKSRSVSNLRKISGPANLDFISRSPPRKKLDIYHGFVMKKTTMEKDRNGKKTRGKSSQYIGRPH